MSENETKQKVKSYYHWRKKINHFHWQLRDVLTDEEWATLKGLEPSSYEYDVAFEKIMVQRLGEFEIRKLL